ncbi:hypothetical protein MNEG_16349, partial [Monoraphidium neglectum]
AKCELLKYDWYMRVDDSWKESWQSIVCAQDRIEKLRGACRRLRARELGEAPRKRRRRAAAGLEAWEARLVHVRAWHGTGGVGDGAVLTAAAAALAERAGGYLIADPRGPDQLTVLIGSTRL